MARPAVIAFYSYKGGVGRTLLAANIAVALAARGKTLLWDLDVEAPSMHRIRGLRSEGAIRQGFLDWLAEWQQHRGGVPGHAHLRKFTGAIRRTPFHDLALLPAHGDDADAAALYFGIDWRYWLGEDPVRGRELFDALLDHLGAEGYRHVVLDSRTGLTDLGGLISGVLPDATVLVGGYSAQNLGGLAQIWHALKRDDSEIRALRGDRIPPELFLVASPIPQNDPKLVSVGRELWAATFGLELAAVHEIPFDPELPFSEALLIAQTDQVVATRAVALAYRKLAAALGDLLDRREEGERLASDERRARPDLFARDERGPAASRVERGRRFEERVGGLLRLLGYTVEPEQLVDSNRVDLVARIRSGVDESTYLVECKDRQGTVAKSTLETLKGWLEQPQARAMDARGMVVARRFAPAAIAYGKDHHIRLVTPEELERQLIDLAPYLAAQIAAFEGSMLASAYVTQKARLGADGSSAVPPPRRGARKKKDAAEIEDLVAHGLAWAGGRGSRLWVLLGDYGTGKTAYTQKLAYELAKRARDDTAAPAPLLINLRDVPNKASLEDVLHEHWLRATGERKDPRSFLHLIARGRLVLLLDSFDEMGVATAGRSVVEQLRSLVRLTAAPGETAGGNRVLVTCREQFFREHGEAIRAAAGSDDRMSELQRVALSFDGTIDVLERFTEPQIREYLVKRLGAREGAKAAEFLRKHYLAQLADRPQLLDIMIKSLPKLRQEEQSSGRPITTGALYQAYTNEWLDDFKPRERQSGSEQLRTILELLAGVLWERVGNRIHYGDLYALFKDRPDLRGTLDPQQLDIELRTAAFLSRTPDGHYGFSHRSFLEYFLARQIERRAAEAAGAGAAALAETLDTARLSEEVCHFVDDLVPRQSPRREALRGTLRKMLRPADGAATASSAARANALWLGYRLALAEEPDTADAAALARLQDHIVQYIPRGARLAGVDLSGLPLDGIVLVDANLCAVTAKGAGLRRARLDGADLSDATLSGATLDGASLVAATLRGADCTEVTARAADLTRARAERSRWINARLDGANLEASDFTSADLRAARLARARGRPLLEGATIAGATGRGAEGLPAELVDAPLEHLAAVPFGWSRHGGAVDSVAFSPDGTRLASGGADTTVRLWDAATGTLVRSLAGHEGPVRSVAFSPDGTRLASGGDDATVRLWDAATGTLVRSLAGHEGPVRSVAFSPDGTRLASGGADATVRLWDAATGTLVRSLAGHENWVWSVAFSPDGTRLASGGDDATVRLWDAATGTLVRSLAGHENWVWSVAFSPDGTRLASGGADATVRLWDAATGTLVRSLAGHEGPVRSVAFSPDGTRLASGGADATVRLWDAATGTLVRSLAGHENWVWSVAFSPDGTRLASGGDDATVRLWDAATGTLVRSLAGHENWVWSVAFSPDGTRLASGGADATVRLWDAATGTLVRSLAGHEGPVRSVAFSPDGTRLASGGADATVRLWDAATGTLVRSLAGHENWVWSVAFSPDGTRLASGGDDATVRLWDAATGTLVRSLAGHEGPVWSVAFSPDGTRLASGGDDATVRLWDAATGTLVRSLAGHEGPVWSVAFSPDGTRLASGGADATVRLWDAATGTLVRSLAGHEGPVWSVAFSPDGTRLASGGADATVRLWDAATGTLVRSLAGHEGPVRSVAFSPDGTRLASGGDDATVRLWDAATGTLLAEIGAVRAGWFSLDYRTNPRGCWRGAGEGLERLTYRVRDEPTQPAPWIPRDWRAVDLPELAAKS